jgi:glycosyltransferase involved in cell wall biosynthesis
MKVSLIIPCYNEENNIQDLLAAICEQSFPITDLEVIIADGMSSDRTRDKIQEFAESVPELKIRVLDNTKRTIPTALNLAIQAANGEYIIRMDAHSQPHPNYIEYCLRALEAGKGDNVGGVINVKQEDRGWIAQSIATAAAHPLGVGDARYRTGTKAQEVDTVPFGAFHTSLIDKVGLFDESLLSNEDYEFNVRIRKMGGKIWLDPEIKASYLSRSTIKALAAQYWRYGFWKLRMLTRYPETLRWRQLAGLFVLSWLVWGILSIWFQWARWLLLAQAVIYFLSLLIGGIQAAIQYKKTYLVIGLPLAIITMHFSWGTGFLWSLIRLISDRIVRKSD